MKIALKHFWSLTYDCLPSIIYYMDLWRVRVGYLSNVLIVFKNIYNCNTQKLNSQMHPNVCIYIKHQTEIAFQLQWIIQTKYLHSNHFIQNFWKLQAYGSGLDLVRMFGSIEIILWFHLSRGSFSISTNQTSIRLITQQSQKM